MSWKTRWCWSRGASTAGVFATSCCVRSPPRLAPPSVRRSLHAKVADALVGGVGRDPDWRLVASHYEHAESFDTAASAYQQVSAAARASRRPGRGPHLPDPGPRAARARRTGPGPRPARDRSAVTAGPPRLWPQTAIKALPPPAISNDACNWSVPTCATTTWWRRCRPCGLTTPCAVTYAVQFR